MSNNATVKRDANTQAVLDRLVLSGEADCAGVSSGAWSLEALVSGYGDIDLREVAVEIAAGWRALGTPAPEAAPATARTCSVNACQSMAYIRLKTAGGPRSLCLGHWQSDDFAKQPDAA